MLSEATGDFFLAKAPLQQGALPPDIRSAIDSERPEIRGGAVSALARIANSSSIDHESRIAAIRALGLLCNDADATVQERARRTVRILYSQRSSQTDASVRAAIYELKAPRQDNDTSGAPSGSTRREITGSYYAASDPEWYQARGVLRSVRPLFPGLQRRRHRGPKGHRPELDYLQWLGIDCIWLPPFFDSPLRDGGYDVVGLHRDPARVRRPRRLREVRRGGARQRASG